MSCKQLPGSTPGTRWATATTRIPRPRCAKFKQHFGADIEVFPVFNGTAANCLSLKALTESYHAVICTEAAHIHTDECGAPEKFTGCKLILIDAPDGKLTVESRPPRLPWHRRPASRSAESDFDYSGHRNGDGLHSRRRFAIWRALPTSADMFLHMDGARIANAAVSLGLTLREATRDLGVDVLSFGGTKNGAMGAEAVVFFDKTLARDFLYLRKQGMQLASKMRFISAQFDALLSNDLWRKNAAACQPYGGAAEAKAVSKIPGVKIVYPVEANGVFAQIPRRAIATLQKRYFFYVWNEEESRGALDVFVRHDGRGCQGSLPGSWRRRSKTRPGPSG